VYYMRVTAVPEPSSVALALAGGLAWFIRRRSRD
jgi:PEP-CTERM motif